MTKKIIAAIITIIICMSMLTACGKKGEVANVTPPTDPTTLSTEATIPAKEEVPEEVFPLAPLEEDALSVYRKEVAKRAEVIRQDEDASFITEEEREFLIQNGYNPGYAGTRVSYYDDWYDEVSRYYYPVLYRDSQGVMMYYTNEYGNVRSETVTGSYRDDYFDSLHHNGITENEEEIIGAEGYALTYSPKTGKITMWDMGEVVREHFVPEESVYVGHSAWEGYLFRSGTDVYAVREFGTYLDNDTDWGAEVIAHNVQEVILADYYLSSDPWSQPLFLMTDGTIKAYCRWEGESDVPVDDEAHLVDIRHEGGYGKYIH